MVTPTEEDSINQFKGVRQAHNEEDGNQCVHIIQSFSPSDSKKLTPREVNEMGMQLASEYWKDHQILVVTHTDTGKFHNHIVVNTIAMESGDRIQYKAAHWHALADRSDALCLAKGLSVLPRDEKTRRYKFPEKALRMMEARGAHSWVNDVMQKANVAREWATSYDEYRGYLALLGVGVQIEDKNITYFYPGRKKGKRGDKLGENFHKEKLEEKFKANDLKFAKNPELRAQISGALEAGKAYQPYQAPKANKDYSAYTKTARGQHSFEEIPELKHLKTFLPLEELRKARSGNILEYCKKHDIELIDAGNGWHKLAKREHVEINENWCKNTKNNHYGNIIDFVAAHRQSTYLQAVAHLNNNPNLLLLEQKYGEQKHYALPFYFPKKDRLAAVKAIGKISDILSKNGSNPKTARNLLRNEYAYATKEGAVHFLGKNEKNGVMEFLPDDQGGFTARKRGEITKPFFASRGSGSKAVLFSDHFTFLRKMGPKATDTQHRRDGILVLLEPSEKIVDSFLSANKHVKELHFVSPAHRSLTSAELDFFNVLKAKCAPFGISVHQVPVEKTLTREGPNLGLGI